jgi:hypothetical protein
MCSNETVFSDCPDELFLDLGEQCAIEPLPDWIPRDLPDQNCSQTYERLEEENCATLWEYSDVLCTFGYGDTLDVLNMFFTWIFFVEAVLKLIAYGINNYFADSWNDFDFFVVVVTVVEFFLTVFTTGELPGASILRVFRIARILRLVRRMKDLQNLFLTLINALPTIANVGGLLGLLFFIYAVLGMHIFGEVIQGEFITDHAGFHKFSVSLLTVFRMATGESWNGIMNECRVTLESGKCYEEVDECGNINSADWRAAQVVDVSTFIYLFIALSGLQSYTTFIHDAIPRLSCRHTKNCQERY